MEPRIQYAKTKDGVSIGLRLWEIRSRDAG